MSQTDCNQEKEQSPTSYTLHNKTHEWPWSRVDREPPLGETHPVNCCKSQQSERLYTQEPKEMPSSCPDKLPQRPFVSSARTTHLWRDPYQRQLKVHNGGNAMTVSMLHPWWPQPHLTCLHPRGSAPARKPAVHKTVRQGLQDVQNHEWSCWQKPCCRSARAQKP